MNYFLLVVILIVCAGAYYMHVQDDEQITTLQAEVERAEKAPASVPASTAATTAPTANGAAPASTGAVAPSRPSPAVHSSVLVNPEDGGSGSVDAASAAARAAADSEDIGTVTTLDNRTYANCKVIKVDPDGVTFSYDQGIAKIEYAMMRPDLQKRFGYTPQGAVARTEAELRADQQQQAAQTNAAPPAP